MSIDAAAGNAILAHYGRAVIQNYASRLQNSEDLFPLPERAQSSEPVGILGAGVGGLYAALMLQSLNVTYEILESSDRTGGRLFTHQFPGGGRYDYYDIGAMRYPLPPLDPDGNYEPGVMQRVGDLFKYIGMQDKLIPYYYASNKTAGFQYFNGVRVRLGDKNDFRAKELNIDQAYVDATPSKIVDDVVLPFAQALYADLQNHTTTGWEKMLAADAHSTRSYMTFEYTPSPELNLPGGHLSTKVVNWIETFDKSTGWYDRGLTETVLEAIAFGQAGGPAIDWKCIDGGSHVLSDTMVQKIQQAAGSDAIKLNKPVTAIGLTNPKYSNSTVTVTAGGQDHVYSHVISTLPLPNLRAIDLSGSNLDVMQSNALRASDYGPSIKIGILFSEPWWTHGADRDGTPFNIVGGQSFTDLPIRTVVYPSYGVYSDQPPNLIIASYCWTYDAERLGAFIGTGQPKFDDQLKALVLADLAEVHNVDVSYLSSRLRDIHAWDWNHNPLSGGAFAFYGPGDFGDQYAALSRPAADNKLHFAGEALSIRHAWVVGALDSAWRSVYSYLFYTDPSKLDAFYSIWGKNPEWFETEPGTGKASDKSVFEKYLRLAHRR